MALPDDKRPGTRGAVACLPAARSHEEPDPGGFRCISTKTDPEHSGPFVVQESVVALPDDKRPEKKRCSCVPPSSTEPQGTRPRRFQVHIYKKKPRPGTFRPLHFSGALGWRCRIADSQSRQRHSSACPAALSHKEPDPGGFKCISRITDPESHAERKLLLLLLVKMTPPPPKN